MTLHYCTILTPVYLLVMLARSEHLVRFSLLYMPRYSRVSYRAVCYIILCYCIVMYGIEWYGMRWCCMVRYCMVLYCIVQVPYHTSTVLYHTILNTVQRLMTFQEETPIRVKKENPPPADTQKMKLVCIIRYHTIAMVWYHTISYHCILHF